MSGNPEPIALETEDGDVARLAQACRALRHRVEHGSDVRRRVRDDFEYLAGRRLLGERLGQVAVLGFEFLEQPDVLDPDHRLAGEGLQQLDLVAGEPPRPGARYHTDAGGDS